MHLKIFRREHLIIFKIKTLFSSSIKARPPFFQENKCIKKHVSLASSSP